MTKVPRLERLNVLTKEEIVKNALENNLISFDIEYEVFRSDGEERHYSDDDFDIHGCSFGVVVDGQVFATYFTKRQDIQYIIDNTFTVKSVECWGWFSKFDYTCLVEAGYNVPLNFNIRDGAIGLNLENEERQKYGLKVVTPEILGYELTSFGDASEAGLDDPRFLKYAAEDSLATLEHAVRLKEVLVKDKLYYVFDLISPSSIVFGDMERRGVYWDINIGEDLHHKFIALRDTIEEEIYSSIGRININSPKQLSHRLFSELGYTAKNLDKTSTGQISTADKNIQKLAEKYPVCELIAAHRTCNKMVSSYIEPFTLQSIYREDGRIHGRFGFLLKTGRTSCVDPPLQTVPSNPLGQKIKFNQKLADYLNDIKLRSGFIAPEGRAIIVRDYSSLEYRTAAIAAPEPVLIDMYQSWDCESCGASGKSSKVVRVCDSCGGEAKQGKDLHTKNMNIANRFQGVNVTRKGAKELSFLSIFYGTAWKLANSWNIPVEVAEQILHAVFDEFSGLKRWHPNFEKILRSEGVRDGQGRVMSQGEVRCMFGRRRKVNIDETRKRIRKLAAIEKWDSKTLDKKIRGAEKNLANMIINFVCQSPACTCGLIALNRFRTEVINRGWYDKVWIVNFIHDEIVVECPEEMAEEVDALLRDCMENAIDIGVPLQTEGDIARHSDIIETSEASLVSARRKSWADCK